MTDLDIEQFHEEKRRRWLNPILYVKSENAYSIVAKPEYSSENRPFIRFKKYKDENGFFVVLSGRRRVYQENWKGRILYEKTTH